LDNVKKTYYIAIANGEIFSREDSSPWNFKISATDDEITLLRDLFDENHANEWENFIRAHIPFIEYHHDKENTQYDQKLQKIYGVIYSLGDQEAREHIAGMGILPDENQGI